MRTAKRGKKTSAKSEKAKKKCTNPKCLKPGHTIEECFAEGGGCEGQWPMKLKPKLQTKTNASMPAPSDAKAKVAYADGDEKVGSNMLLFMMHAEEKVNAVNDTKDRINATTWLLDSGATKHMAPNQKWFSSYRRLEEPKHVWLGDHTYIMAISISHISIELNLNGQKVDGMFKNVLHVPKLGGNLLSISQLTWTGSHVLFKSDGATIMHHMTGREMAKARCEGGLYQLRVSILNGECAHISIISDSSDDGKSDVYSYISRSTPIAKASIEMWH